MLWSDSPHPTSSTGKAVSSATCIRNCVAVRCNFARNFHAWGRGQICKQIAAIRFAYATAPSVLDLQTKRKAEGLPSALIYLLYLIASLSSARVIPVILSSILEAPILNSTVSPLVAFAVVTKSPSFSIRLL